MRTPKVLAVGLAVVCLTGCGGGGGTATEAPKLLQPVNVTLDGWRGPQAAGILVASVRGYFAEAGLHVTILHPGAPSLSIHFVLSGADELGVTHEPEAVLARERGAPIVIVGSLIPRPTAALIWLKKSKIGGIADLKGKTIAVPGYSFQQKFLASVLAQGGLTLADVKVENAGYEAVSDLASGRADAVFGGTWNLEGAELEADGLEPVVTKVEDLGVPPYDELVVVARADRLAKEPQLVRSFMAALARGTAAALEDPEEVVKATEEYGETNPETSPKALKAQVKATLPLLSRDNHVSPSQARALVDWMHEEGMIRRKVPVSKLLTNAYLKPPQPPGG
jgi:putative hydroxymethylpyrimidine transport system substrate-binding protein